MDDALTKKIRRRLKGEPSHRTDFLAAQTTIRQLLAEGYSGPVIHRALVAEGTLCCSYRTWRRLMAVHIESSG